MTLRPLSTLPLRVGLKLRLRRAKRERDAQQSSLRETLRQISRRPPRPAGATVDDVLFVDIHPYALVGHQLSAWMSGYLWARDLQLELESAQFSKDPQGTYAVGTKSAPKVGARRILLPSVNDERDPTSIQLLAARVELARRRWPEERLRFELALDQPRWDLTPASEALRIAVLRGPLGDRLRELEATAPYVAIHIRRPASVGEISPQAHPDRWIDASWYVRVISEIRSVKELREIPIRIISLGGASEFEQLARLEGVELCLNGDRDDDFLRLAAARVLVFAPSSFSYNAALVSKQAVIGRAPWWHEIPSSGRWVRLGPDGELDRALLERALVPRLHSS